MTRAEILSLGRFFHNRKGKSLSIAQYVSASFVTFTIILLSIRPEPAVAVAVFCTTALFVGVSLIERKQNTEFYQLSAQVKDLKNKVEMLLLGKGFGR